MKNKAKRICCYLSGEVNCGKSDCFLVAVAGTMASIIIIGWFIVL